MVKRTHPVSMKRYYYTIFALLVMLACWETNWVNAAVVAADIPQQSIRLRILANSDSAADQLVKKQVRDAIIENMNVWVADAKSLDEARSITRNHLPELNNVVGQVLKQKGFHYAYNVELGVVDFPTKVYGTKLYPEGDYEAVRVVLGDGQGKNWWCVLFPPLCFVEIASAEAAEDKENAKTAEKKVVETKSTDKKADSKQTASSTTKQETPAKKSAASEEKQVAVGGSEPEIRFFIWDFFKKIFA